VASHNSALACDFSPTELAALPWCPFNGELIQICTTVFYPSLLRWQTTTTIKTKSQILIKNDMPLPRFSMGTEFCQVPQREKVQMIRKEVERNDEDTFGGEVSKV
jgi:hypothetical protein